MSDTPIIPDKVFTLLHMVEFGARIAGYAPDADALQKLEPTLEAAARGLQMAMPAIGQVLALIEAHVAAGKPAAAAVAAAEEHVAAAPEMQREIDRQGTEA